MWRELGPTHQVISFLPYVWDTLACSEYSSIYNNSSEIMSLTSLTSKTLLMSINFLIKSERAGEKSKRKVQSCKGYFLG